ncbi:intermembrane lipid transfer protein VPS13B [Sabethes cyaneus]|uniref:intermembrane lipid transfer protein VPS13B n=1 Tax=Sabethes cyaneus TaxID=53552 RepID=UPI00237EBE08|nr:intermembrane lipid transfer protein VPS13B [Sabethes cyaneus]
MFKIESYITPIILSYVEKYVKNIRPEDSQVSLWGGEVVFQNLDLKLDVLEEELSLPFQFLSGHIHELAIRVPWTKIASEPIAITINTIEFVLKLQEPGNRSVPRKDSTRRKQHTDETPPPGYMASLINKIANNVSIRCHNVILKYVEEDIVVSMNIQQLSMESANSNWLPAFIDISPTRISLRKLINIVDLTICLDKRNSAGKIEMCQEPVLYRSTLQARVLMKYNNASTQDKSSITRIDVHSKFLDFNVSSQQFPMLMRLFELGMALKQGKIKSEISLGQESSTEGENDTGQESLLSWAWNLLPSFFPEENESDHTDDHEFHVFHSGCYVDRLRMIFKTQELIGDSMVGTARKIKYNPFLQLDLHDVYGEVVMCGLKWFNFRGGIAKTGLRSLEDCPCGHPLTVENIFLSESGDVQDNQHIKGSFFDGGSSECKKYNVNWSYHLGTYSQDVLLARSPAISLDVVHEVQVPDDRRTSEFGSDLEFSNLSEKYMIRAFLGKFCIKISADTLHRMTTLISYRNAYEYSPYYEDKPIPSIQQLPPPSAEDYDALMSEIPLKQMHITIITPRVDLHPLDHSKLQPGRKRSSSKGTHNPSSAIASIEFNRIEYNILTPLYPNRLIFTTCQLPEPPSKLFDSCFRAVSGNLERMQAKLLYNDSEIIFATAINLNQQHRNLIYPELWPNIELNKTEHNLGISDVKLILNPHQLLAVYSIGLSLLNQSPSFYLSLDFLSAIRSPTAPTLDLSISRAHLRQIFCERTVCYKLTARSLRCLSYTPATADTQRSLTALWPDHPTEEDFLTVIVQLPVNRILQNLEHPPLFYGRFLDLSLNMDPILYDYLRILSQQLAVLESDDHLTRGHIRHSFSPRKSSERLLPPKKSHSQPITSVHSSSDKVDTPAIAVGPAASGLPAVRPSSTVLEDDTERNPTQNEPGVDLEFWRQLTRRIIFHLEFCHCTVYFPEKSIVQESGYQQYKPNEEFGDNEIVMIKLPLITVNSAFKSTSLSAGMCRFPISLAKSVWPDDRESFPWTVSLADTSSWTYQDRRMNKLLDETTTNISLVLNFKDDGIASSTCFHVDTSPLKVNLCKDQLRLLSSTLSRILSLPMFERAKERGSKEEPQLLEISQKSGGTTTATDLRDFMDITHNSSVTSDETLKEGCKKGTTPISVWLQWTFSKVTVNCIAKDDSGQPKVKLIVELEDIIYSLDMQDVYMQLKAKIGGMSGQCYEFLTEKASWIKNEALALTVQTELSGSSKSGNDAFLNLTITKAETTNVHTKWDTIRKNREQNDTLIEVILKIEQIDLRLDLDLIETCAEVLTIFCPKDNVEAPQTVFGVKDLPLILFTSKGLRLFVPARESTKTSNAYIFTISSITMHHNVENPLCRVPLRPDVYTKAAQMRILNVPGSKIEDRQYELVMKDISLSTANWSDIVAYIESQTSTSAHHDNPAFEWNNLQDVQRSTDFDLNTIFKEFNFSVIYAPCIIYKNVLICGQAMELNCMSDLLMDLNLDQLQLAGQVSRKMINIVQIILPPAQSVPSPQSSVVDFNPSLFTSLPSQDTISIDSVKSLREADPPRVRRSYSKLSKCEEDSGVETFRTSDVKQTVASSSRRNGGCSRQRKLSTKSSSEQLKSITAPVPSPQVIPYEVCFLGGYFKVNLYENTTSKEDKSKTLFRCVLAQPNGLLSLNLLERVVQISLFDLIVELDGLSLLKTLPGEPDGLGIPQPIVKVRFVTSFTKKTNELSVDFRRPMKLTTSHQKMKAVRDLLEVLTRTVGDPTVKGHSTNRHRRLPRPILSRNKFKMIKSYMYDVEKVSVWLSQAMIHLQDEDQNRYDCKLSFSSIQCSLRVQDRPERMSFNLELKELIVCQSSFVILHPFSFNLQACLTQEYWKRDPLIQAKVKSDYLQLDFSSKTLHEIQQMVALFVDMVAVLECDNIAAKAPEVSSTNMTPSRDNLIQIAAPGFSQKEFKGTQEEHYQDDLRAGAFQFVESTKASELPLPYQIKIINRETGIICWRYPQPRALSNVTVYPVPMNASKAVNIRCKLEYYSEIFGEFFELCQFTLSENDKTDLRLPSRKIASAIWRIEMTQNVIYETAENEDEDQLNDSDNLTEPGKSLISNITDALKDTYLSTSRVVSLPYRLHPKIFVACMRVDSMFNSNLVPNVELAVELHPVQVNLFNIVDYNIESNLPKPFERFHFCKETLESRSHKFLMLNANTLKIHTAIYDNFDVQLSGELNLLCDLLDYSHYTFENVLDVVNIKTIATIEEEAFDIKTISDDISIRCGPSVLYNLLVAEKLWNFPHDSVLLYGKYIVCNHTHVGIKVGQHGTGEYIFLGVEELCLYVFRSYHRKQLLQIVFNENTKDIATEPFPVAKEGLFYVRILPAHEEDVDDDKLFVVRIENLSNAQKRVSIEGQINFFNMTSQRLKVQYRLHKIIPNSDKHYVTTSFCVDQNSNVNTFEAANSKIQQSIKIAIDGEKKGWSGDIPMREIMNGLKPYLVKIPTGMTKEGYLSYWVRIIREKICAASDESTETFNERVLVIIWPLFMVQSMLTVNTMAYEEQTDQSHSVYGQGERRQFVLSGTNTDEHELLFRMNFNSPHGEDRRKALLSYRLIEGRSFFQVPERFRKVESAIEMLQKSHKLHWPCSREDELRWKRENAIQEATLPLYHCAAAHEMSCCLMLSIVPWCLLINQLGCSIRLKNCSTGEMDIVEPNNIVMPHYMEVGFTLELDIDITLQSSLIYLTEESRKQAANSYVLPIDGSIDVTLRSDDKVAHLILTSTMENNIRVIIVASQFVVTNYSSIDLQCWCFAVLTNERLEQIRQGESGSCSASLKLLCNDRKCENPQGTALTVFSNLSKHKNKLKFNSTYNYYLTVYQHDRNEFSSPIYLNRAVSRKSICVQYEDRYTALALSIVEHRGQQYISIYDDPCPSFAVENRTDFNIYVAQSESINVNKAANAVTECTVDTNFVWYQIVRSRQTVYYTPPAVDSIFPEAQETEVALIFACVSGSAIRWSYPVKINENKNIFLNIPLYGDLKLAVNIRNRTTEIVIDYISQELEFSAKDIRTRLSNPVALPADHDPLLRRKSAPCNTLPSPSVKGLTANLPSKRLSFRGYFESLNVSLFNDRKDKCCSKVELISFNFDRIGLEMNSCADGGKAMVQFANVQVDNELHNTGEYDFPVILCSEDHETKKSKAAVMPSQFTLDDHLEELAKHALCSIFVEMEVDNWTSVEGLRLKINPIRAYIEDTYINILLDYLMEFLPMNLLFQPEQAVERIKCPPGQVLIPRLVMHQSSYLADPIKFRYIRVEPLHVLLSVHTCMRLYIALDHSPLDFSAFERNHVRTLPIRFGNCLGMHYLSGAIFGGGWVIGSLEILGSPSGLARSVTSGLRDFVSLPMQGLFRGPWGFLVGLTQGSTSLVRNITAGTVNSVTKLATSVARNLDRLTLDTEHVQRTDALRRRRPQGMTEGFTQGLTGLGISLLGAVGGLAHHPLQARRPIDVVTGVGKGIVGALAKPISGAAELVALTGQGMLHSVGYNTMPTPKYSEQVMHRLEPISYKALWEPQALCDGSLLFTIHATLTTRNQCTLVVVGVYLKTLMLLSVAQGQLLEVLDLKTVFASVDSTDPSQVILRIKPELPPPPPDYTSYPISSRTYQFVQESTMQLPNLSAYNFPSLATSSQGRVHQSNHNRPFRPAAAGLESDSVVVLEEDSTRIIGSNNGVVDVSLTQHEEDDVVCENLTFLEGDVPVIEGDDNRPDDNERRLVLYVDESLGRYLVKYINLLKKGLQPADTVAFVPFGK